MHSNQYLRANRWVTITLSESVRATSTSMKDDDCWERSNPMRWTVLDRGSNSRFSNWCRSTEIRAQSWKVRSQMLLIESVVRLRSLKTQIYRSLRLCKSQVFSLFSMNLTQFQLMRSEQSHLFSALNYFTIFNSYINCLTDSSCWFRESIHNYLKNMLKFMNI